MTKHNINIEVALDAEKMPEQINWHASGSGNDEASPAKAFMLALWDGQEKTAMRIDLWTKKMMVDEMNDFFFQTMMTMADTFNRATRNEALAAEFKEFARTFKRKADEALMKESDKAQGQG